MEGTLRCSSLVIKTKTYQPRSEGNRRAGRRASKTAAGTRLCAPIAIPGDCNLDDMPK